MTKRISRAQTFLRVTSACLAFSGLAPLLSACSDSEPRTFAPLDYAYLNKIHLNVSNIEIVDSALPGNTPGDISGKSPTSPQQALEQMARERLIASGSEGSGAFTITKASILHAPGGTLLGELEVHVDLTAPSRGQAGFAQAHITRSLNSGSKDAESPSVLYDLTSQMMQDMNVELEFQIKKSLRDWLVDASGASLKGAIQQQDISPNAPLTISSSTESSTATTAPSTIVSARTSQPTMSSETRGVTAPQEPDAIFPLGEAVNSTTIPTPVQHSPKVGVLALPSGHS